MKKIFTSVIIISMVLSLGCASLKPNPRPWTKKEKVAAGFFILAHTANALSTKVIVDSPYCYEANPIMGKHPSDGEIAVYFSVTGTVALLIGHLYPRTRVPLFLTYGGVNTYLTLHDYTGVEEQERRYGKE